MKLATIFQKTMFWIFLCLSLITCKSLEKVSGDTVSAAPKNIKIESLVCNNLSENLAGVGTLNDEVLLLLYQKDQGSLHQLIGQSEILTIEKEEELVDLQISLSLSGVTSSSELKLVLIELDTERTSQAIIDLLTLALNEENTSSEKIKKTLEDDDLLGVKRINLAERKKTQSISFWGMQMFDEYAYEINCRLN